MSRRCNQCHRITPLNPVVFCPHCKMEFRRRIPSAASARSLSVAGRRPATRTPSARPPSVAGRRPATGTPSARPSSVASRRPTTRASSARPSSHPTSCIYKTLCAEYLSSLRWEETYFNRVHNRCYCSRCYPASNKDTYEKEGFPYVIPRGWCRFGLRVDQVRSQTDRIWDEWIITYHGTSPIAAKSVVAHRQFLVPGDRCIDGSVIQIRPGHIPGKQQIYTSPTIAYSSHECYCPTQRFRSRITNKVYEAKVVLQCRQKPGTFHVQGETIGAEMKRLCQFIPNDQIEFLTISRAAIVTYGLLIQLTEIE